jgi:23S rRNA (uracil1939-C5)-methyltransferase
MLSDGRRAFVPLTLPGELVRARPVARIGDGWLAELDAVIEPVAGRAVPPCRYFGACGGCVAQHWPEAAYYEWKTTLLHDALRRAGYKDPPVSSIKPTPEGSRRRMDLAIRRTAGQVLVGLHRRREASVVDIKTCEVLRPELVALIGPMRSVLAKIAGLRAEGSVVVNLLDSGLDMLLRTDRPLSLADRSRLIDFAGTHGLSRLAWAEGHSEPEPICILRPPETTMSGVVVVPPPGAFLQASAAGEAAIVRAVLEGQPPHLPRRGRIGELYAGCGTLTFALARHSRVVAWEGDGAAVAALRSATQTSALAGRIDVQQRNLVRQPLSAAELTEFAAVVLDPPHAGAAAQIAAIAASLSPRVIYVSCNPSALARDARVLHAAGYSVQAATPIDQFLWSARLESVVVFRR